MSKRDLLVRIDTEFGDKGFKSAEQSAQVLARELNKAEQAERNMANLQMAAFREAEARRAKQLAGYTQIGTAAGLMGAAIAAGLGIAGKATMDWESAWAGVTKTVNGSQAEMDVLENQLRSLARTLPASHEEIAAVAEAAGQLGVKRRDIASFTKTMIDLGVSTNLSSEEAATGLSRLGNIMGVLPSQADRAGAALVALGNDGASTEAEILEMSLRIAGAGKTIGITEAQVMGFANALSSMGIEAEAGGSAISRVMVDVAQAVDKGGDKLEVMARLAGMTGQQFKTAFQRDAAGAIVSMIEGLGRLDASGQSTFDVLDKLGWSNIRIRDTMLRASQSGDLLRNSVELGNRAWEENTALVNEANKRYETSASRVKIARNELNDAAIDIGAVVLPAMAGAADRVGALANAFRTLPEWAKTSVVVLGAIASAALLAGGAALVLIPKLAALNATLLTMGPRGAAAARGLSAVGGALTGPWGLALAGATIAMGVWAEKQYEAKAAQDEMRASLDQQTGAITNNTRAIAAKKLQDEGLLDIAKAQGIALSDLTDAAVGQGDGMDRLAAAQKRYNDAYVAMQNAFKAGQDVDYDQLTTLEAKSTALNTLVEATRKQRGELAPLIEATKQQAEAVGQEGDATDAAVDPTQAMTDVLGGMGDEAADAEKALQDLITSVEEFGSSTLNAHAAARDYQEAIDKATESVEKNGKTVNKARTAFNLNTAAGRENQAALEAIASSALKSATANFQNGESVKKVTGEVDKARGQFIDMAVKMGLSKTAANRLADQLGLTKQNVGQLSDAIKKTPTSHNTNMTVQTKAAMEAVARLQTRINSLRGNDVRINVRYVDIGKNPTSKAGGITKADGGIVEFYANGGIREDHRAQIVPAGTYRVFAEDETGGEGYIPLSPSKRGPSIPVWYEVGRRLGVLERGLLGAPGAYLAGGAGSSVDRSVHVTAYGHTAAEIARLMVQAQREDEALHPVWG